MYVKQIKSPNTIIVRNTTRQIMTLLTVNKNNSTLITYESESYEKKNSNYDSKDEKFREWGNINKIKLWDIHHLTVYQTFVMPVDASLIKLLANGLYVVTAQRGYVGFYALF
jgi:hypothetical protein